MDVQEVRKFLADRVLWLGQSGVLITTAGGKTIYIDPHYPVHRPVAGRLCLPDPFPR